MSSCENYHLNIAEIIVADKPATISTVLGSCISVCLFTKNNMAGGMIHYALPEPQSGQLPGDPYRYGSLAIPKLIEELQKATGMSPESFVAKIVGGASETGGNMSSYPVGEENIKVARKILQHYHIPIVGESVGGVGGKKVLFHIPSGRLQVASLAPNSKSVKVLVVDDSKVIRSLLHRILSEDSNIKVIGMAEDAMEAAAFIKKEQPDVITLDIHMPQMTGVEWLAKLLPLNPIPTVMISSLQLKEGNEVFKALELGAVDYIQKPSLQEIGIVGPIIREKVKAAAGAQVRRIKPALVRAVASTQIDFRNILAIGASTGGTEALKSILCQLPAEIPPTVIVQHIPPVFSKAFADRLNELCPFEVKEAEHGDELRKSRVLIAPGGRQMRVRSSAGKLFVDVNDDAPVSRHKPSVDYLFHSVATTIKQRAVGVILTGMGADGAKGLLEMKKNGARTLGQDEESCVVYGMPKVAFELGAVDRQYPLGELPQAILDQLSKTLNVSVA